MVYRAACRSFVLHIHQHHNQSDNNLTNTTACWLAAQRQAKAKGGTAKLILHHRYFLARLAYRRLRKTRHTHPPLRPSTASHLAFLLTSSSGDPGDVVDTEPKDDLRVGVDTGGGATGDVGIFSILAPGVQLLSVAARGSSQLV